LNFPVSSLAQMETNPHICAVGNIILIFGSINISKSKQIYLTLFTPYITTQYSYIHEIIFNNRLWFILNLTPGAATGHKSQCPIQYRVDIVSWIDAANQYNKLYFDDLTSFVSFTGYSGTYPFNVRHSLFKKSINVLKNIFLT